MACSRPRRQFYRELVGALGVKTADALLERFGGQQVWVSAVTSKSRGHPPRCWKQLQAFLGPAKARLLSGIFGGEYIRLPIGRSVYNDLELRRLAARLHREHKTTDEIAKTVRRGHRTVQRWLSEPVSTLKLNDNAPRL